LLDGQAPNLVDRFSLLDCNRSFGALVTFWTPIAAGGAGTKTGGPLAALICPRVVGQKLERICME